MYEAEDKVMNPEEELIDTLLDFIIVSASLAKKVNQAMKIKQIKEGGNVNGKNQRIGNGNHRPSQSCNRY